jgi:hypothetical protein
MVMNKTPLEKMAEKYPYKPGLLESEFEKLNPGMQPIIWGMQFKKDQHSQEFIDSTIMKLKMDCCLNPNQEITNEAVFAFTEPEFEGRITMYALIQNRFLFQIWGIDYDKYGGECQPTYYLNHERKHDRFKQAL